MRRQSLSFLCSRASRSISEKICLVTVDLRSSARLSGRVVCRSDLFASERFHGILCTLDVRHGICSNPKLQTRATRGRAACVVALSVIRVVDSAEFGAPSKSAARRGRSNE